MQKNEKNLEKLFLQIHDYFSPKIIGEINDVYVKITKTKGNDVPWHTHDDEDEMFYIVKGSLIMQLENEESFKLNEGEFYIVKKGVLHRVESENECWILLIENKDTKHTGSVRAGITKSIEEQL